MNRLQHNRREGKKVEGVLIRMKQRRIEENREVLNSVEQNAAK